MTLHLKKVESHLLIYDLCQVWLKLDRWFIKRRFLNFLNLFFPISYHHHLKKRHGASFEQTYIPFTQLCFVPRLVELGPWFWRRSKKSDKFTNRQTDRWTHRRLTSCDQKNSGLVTSSGELKPTGDSRCLKLRSPKVLNLSK